MEWIGVTAGIFGIATLLTGAYLVVRSSIPKETIRQQRELIDTLSAADEVNKGSIKELQEKHHQSETNLALLQGQVDVLKTVPLQQIQTDIGSISKNMAIVADTQTKIVLALKQKKAVSRTK